ncbi:MAG: class I SAM-dependent methyltransferase [Deltaproteobacteria bacterium]|nr:class I SAM-dependent methyltransferase [Deltaproteobacteria bacterium]
MSGPDAVALADNLRRLELFYGPRLAEHGTTHKAVGWLRPESQRVRFENLAVVAGLDALSVLDVGSGLGDLYPFLRARGHRGDYLGLDALPEMVARARALHPDARFLCADVNDDEVRVEADVVFASGVITFSEPEVARHTIAALFRSARQIVGFNALSTWDPAPAQPPVRPHDPLEILAFCKTLTPYVMLRHDYSVQDFTIHLFRGPHTPA